jgi:hypothetical protein
MGQTLLAVLADGPYGAADKVGSMNRENSPYYRMNAALREKKRENVVPWRNYI